MQTLSSLHNVPSTQALANADAIANDIKDGTLSAFVGSGADLAGETNFKGMLRVDGHLGGRISSPGGTLIVSDGGHVDADVQVAVVQIYGTVNGDVVATERIEVRRTARVTGSLRTPSLTLEDGARFDGACRMTPPSGKTP